MNTQIKDVNFTNIAIEIHYGKDQIFYSYKDGGDLADLDDFLFFLVPEIDFEKINVKTAYTLEHKLYRQLSEVKLKRVAFFELENFARYIKYKYTATAKEEKLDNGSAQKFLKSVVKVAKGKMEAIAKNQLNSKLKVPPRKLTLV